MRRVGPEHAIGALAVERGPFLLLTAAIAAGACSSSIPAPQPTRIRAEYEPEPQVERPPSESLEVVEPARAEPAPALAVEVAATPEPGQEIFEPCNSVSAPDPSCAATFDVDQCYGVASRLEPKAAATVIGCIARESKRNPPCGAIPALTSCSTQLLANVRKLDTADIVTCKGIVGGCGGRGEPGFSVGACQKLLAVYRASGESDAVTCMQNYCGTSACVAETVPWGCGE